MRFIQPVVTPGIQIGIVVTQYHSFGYAGIQIAIGPDNGGKQAAKVDDDSQTDKQVKPFGLISVVGLMHTIKPGITAVNISRFWM
jgi:hypothetical protein